MSIPFRYEEMNVKKIIGIVAIVFLVLLMVLGLLPAHASTEDSCIDLGIDTPSDAGVISKDSGREIAGKDDPFKEEERLREEAMESTIKMTLLDLEEEETTTEGPVRLLGSEDTYETLQEALAAASSNAVVEITRDMIVMSNVSIVSDVTIKGAGGEHTLMFAPGASLMIQGGALTLGGGDKLLLTGTDETVQVYGGSLEVTSGASIQNARGTKVSVHVNTGSVSITGGMVLAYGDYASAIEVDRGDVAVYSGLVSAIADSFKVGYAIKINDSGTVKVLGGNVLVSGSGHESDAIYMGGSGIAAFLKGTCSGGFVALDKSIIVEVESLAIPHDYADTHNGLKLLANKTAALTDVKWNLSNAIPALTYGSYVVSWGVPDAPPLPTEEAKPVRLQETFEAFSTYSEAIAGVDEITTYDLFGHPVLNNAPDTAGAWSLVNLTLTILSVLALVVLVKRAITGRTKEVDREVYFEDCEHETITKINLTLFLVSTATPAFSILLFVLTQDLTLPSVLFDLWTFAFAPLFICGLVASILSIKKEEVIPEEPEDYLAAILINY